MQNDDGILYTLYSPDALHNFGQAIEGQSKIQMNEIITVAHSGHYTTQADSNIRNTTISSTSSASISIRSNQPASYRRNRAQTATRHFSSRKDKSYIIDSLTHTYIVKE